MRTVNICGRQIIYLSILSVPTRGERQAPGIWPQPYLFWSVYTQIVWVVNLLINSNHFLKSLYLSMFRGNHIISIFTHNLKLWRMWGTLSLPLLPGPLGPGVVVPARVLSMGQIELFNHLLYLKPFKQMTDVKLNY